MKNKSTVVEKIVIKTICQDIGCPHPIDCDERRECDTYNDCVKVALAVENHYQLRLKELCKHCENNIQKLCKRCPFRSISNDFCWE